MKSLLLTFMLAVTALWALTSGSTPISLGDPNPEAQTILWQLRLPRIVLAMLVGGGLAVAGLLLQGLMRNPLADPYLMGVSSGAALGGSVLILAGLPAAFGFSLLPLGAFAGGLGTVLAVYQLGRQAGAVRVEKLLLAGVAVSAFTSALLSSLLLWSGKGQTAVVAWLLGNLSAGGWPEVAWVLPYLLMGTGLALTLLKPLAVTGLGEREAFHLGIDPDRLKRRTLAVGTLMAAAAVSVSGVIGFVGLMVPHICRQLFQSHDPRRLFWPCLITGAWLLLFADTVARTALAPQEIPVGLVTALLGAPFFLGLLRQSTPAEG